MRISSNGDVYKGEWKQNKKDGYGIIEIKGKNGYVYEGEWVDNMKQGRGKIVYADSTKQEGIFKNDQFYKAG